MRKSWKVCLVHNRWPNDRTMELKWDTRQDLFQCCDDCMKTRLTMAGDSDTKSKTKLSKGKNNWQWSIQWFQHPLHTYCILVRRPLFENKYSYFFFTCRRYLSNLKPKRWGNEKISKVVIIGERTLLIPNLKKLSDLDRPGDLSYVPIKCQECYWIIDLGVNFLICCSILS